MLRTLSLQDTRVTDTGLTRIGTLGELRSLELDGTLITDDGISALAGLASIERLGLRDTKITEKGLTRLKDLKNLQRLTLRDPGFGDIALAALHNVPQIRELSFFGTYTADGDAGIRRVNPRIEIIERRCAVLLDPFFGRAKSPPVAPARMDGSDSPGLERLDRWEVAGGAGISPAIGRHS